MGNTPREVQLPVCPTCGLISKQLSGMFKGYCTGPLGASHAKVRMKPILFREVHQEETSDA